jgi:hypothetical protein
MRGLRPGLGELVLSRLGGQILGYGCQCSFQQSAGVGKWMESRQGRDGCSEPGGKPQPPELFANETLDQLS